MASFFEDYLDRLEELHQDISTAIEDLPGEALDWTAGEDIPSLCVLVNHIAGAERYWIGDVAGGAPSDRNREAEFQAKNQDAGTLLNLIQDVQTFEKNLLGKITITDLESICISPRTGRRFTVGWALMHALEHTAIHLGHIQIIRQLWDQQSSAITEQA